MTAAQRRTWLVRLGLRRFDHARARRDELRGPFGYLRRVVERASQEYNSVVIEVDDLVAEGWVHPPDHHPPGFIHRASECMLVQGAPNERVHRHLCVYW